MYVCCLDLGGTNIRGTWIGNSGARGVLTSVTRPPSLEGTKQVLVSIIRRIGQDAPEDISGIGLASAGPLDYLDKRYLATTNTPELDYFQVGDFLQAEFNLPVLMENDAQAAAMGEVWQGSLAGSSNAVVLTLGTGVGSGVILNDHIWRGDHLTGPELGHVFMGENRKLCGCGQYGCAETWLNNEALLELFKESGCIPDGLREMVFSLENGDDKAWDAIETYGKRLGFYISILQVVFGIDNICVSGGLSAFVPYCRHYIWLKLKERLQNRQFWIPERIVASADPEMSALYGMARAWMPKRE